MKYRIIERKNSTGRPYYIAQYLDDYLEWCTLRELCPDGLSPHWNNKRFSSVRKARRALQKKEEEMRRDDFSRLVEESSF